MSGTSIVSRASLIGIRIVVALAFINLALPFAGPLAAQIGHWPAEPGEKETDREQMIAVWKAIMTYVAEKGETPDYLSDLVPRYLKNKDLLISPLSKRVGVVFGNAAYDDPKLPTSYCYEFSGLPFFGGDETFRELKMSQMQEFGGVVPILRCFLYDRVLNVSYAGDFYETPLYWESSDEAKKLMEKNGTGAGLIEGESILLKVEDAETGKPMKNAEVQLTERLLHSLPLPDRTMHTDDEGLVQIPLGKPATGGRTVKVTLAIEGYEPAVQRFASGHAEDPQTIQVKPKQTQK